MNPENWQYYSEKSANAERVSTKDLLGLKLPFDVNSYQLLYDAAINSRNRVCVEELGALVTGIEGFVFEVSDSGNLWEVSAFKRERSVVSFSLFTRLSGGFPHKYLHAKNFMKFTLNHLWPNVNRVVADWMPESVDYKIFYDQTGRGASLDEAMKMTWTAKALSELGFVEDPSARRPGSMRGIFTEFVR